jgi:hypothetical protein
MNMSNLPVTNDRLSSSLSFASRPFDGIANLTESLAMCEMNINGKSYPIGSISLPSADFPVKVADVDVFVSIDDMVRDVEEMGLNPGHVNLACVGYGTIIAASSVIFDRPLLEVTSPTRIPIAGANPLVFSSVNGFDIHVFVYLAKKKVAAEDTFTPTIPGTWLANARFSISPQVGLTRFAPTPLDSQIRKVLGLPADCLTYVFINEEVLDHDSLEDMVTVYVDADVLRLLQENPQDPLSLQVQLDLVVTTIITLLTKSAHIIASNGLWDSLTDSLQVNPYITQLAMQFAVGSSSTAEQILRLSLEEPGMLRALIESNFKMLKKTSSSLREVQ